MAADSLLVYKKVMTPNTNHHQHRQMGDYLLQARQTSDYFLECGDPGQGCPVYPGNQLTPLINATAYFPQLYDDINRLRGGKGEFLYISGFVLNWLYPGDPLTLPSPKGPVRLIDLVREKARAGVDTRVLAWIPWNLSLANRVDLRPESADNMRTILALRQEPAVGAKACLNIIAHPAGSTHVKLIVMGGPGWCVGYSGGIDLSPDRYDPNWQDVQARVEGPGVQPMFDLFRLMWNQNLEFAGQGGNQRGTKQRIGRMLRSSRPVSVTGRIGTMMAVLPGTPPIEPRRLSTQRAGPHLAQSLLTIPSFKFALSPLLFRWRVSPLGFAPEGLFTVRDAVYRAIDRAERYIYIEDQYFWSVEIMQRLRQSVCEHPNLRVLLVTGTSEQLGPRLDHYRVRAVSEGLLGGLTEQQRSRIIFIQRPDMVHSKTMLIDDQWAMIGSVNMARRSLYTDIEHGLAFEDTQNRLVRDYRMALWKMRLGNQASGADLNDLERCLIIWQQDSGRRLAQDSIEVDNPGISPIDREWYDMVDDPDSRQPWYFPLRRDYGSFISPNQSD